MTRRLFNVFLFAALSFPIIAHAQGDTFQGERLYENKCGRCHLAYAPEKYSLEQWKTIMTEMGPLSGLNQDSESAILDYLGQKASEKKVGELPTNPVLGGYLYTEFFSSPASTDTFDIHYLNLNLTGRLHERVSYRAEFEYEHGGGSESPAFIEQAYMDVWLQKNVAIRTGAILVPFNRFDDFHAPLENQLVTRPQLSREIGVSAWKDVGVNVHGNVFFNDKFFLNYDAYVVNGLGAGSRLRGSRQYRDNNNAKSTGFRISGVYADRLEVGSSYYHGAWDDEGNHDVDMLGFHLLGRAGDFNLYAEYGRFTSENPEPIDRGSGDGYFVQASYMIKGLFRPTVRFGTLDYLDLGNMLGRKPTDFDRKVIALGFNYYMTRSIVFKFEYDFYREGDRNLPKDNNLLALQAAVRF